MLVPSGEAFGQSQCCPGQLDERVASTDNGLASPCLEECIDVCTSNKSIMQMVV